jgi:hypothetical protein
MKKLIIASFGLLASGLLAQSTNIKVVPEYKKYTQHSHRYQISTNLADLVYLSPGIEAAYFTHAKNAVGAKLSIPFLTSGYEDVYTSLNNGLRLEVFNKYFFTADKGISSSVYYFTRVGTQFSMANLNYNRSDWFEILEDDLTFLIYETRSFSETAYRLNFSLAFGFQTVYDSFYIEFYGGIIYGGALNKTELEGPSFNQDYWGRPYSFWANNHILPALGVSMGFGKPRP